MLWGIPISIVIYFVVYWIFLILYKCSFPSEFEFWLFDLRIGELYDKVISEHKSLNSSQVFALLTYSLISCLSGLWLGNYTREKIIESGWDVRYKILRFSNDWFYMLSGRDLAYVWDANGIKELKKISTTIDVLCVIDHSPIIYSGYVLDYNLKKDGSLEFIRITSAVRTPLVEFNNDCIFLKDRTYAIPGNGLIIKGEEIKNINCRYSIIPKLKVSS